MAKNKKIINLIIIIILLYIVEILIIYNANKTNNIISMILYVSFNFAIFVLIFKIFFYIAENS